MRYKRQLIVAMIIVVGYLFLGTLVYHAIEDWSYVDSFYFTGVTLTTVGYGDLLPTHTASKLFSVFLAFSGIGVVFYSAGIVAKYYLEREEGRLHRIWENASSAPKRVVDTASHLLPPLHEPPHKK